MKNIKKIFVFLLMVSIFSLGGIERAKADDTKAASGGDIYKHIGLGADASIGDLMVEILKGNVNPNVLNMEAYIDPDKYKNLTADFNGNYILFCKYKSGSRSEFNIYYSLKDDHTRAFYTIRVSNEDKLSYVNQYLRGNTKKLNTSRDGYLKLNTYATGVSSSIPSRYAVYNTNLTYSDEINSIMKQLVNGECPSTFSMTAFKDDLSVGNVVLGSTFTKRYKNYQDCLGSSCPKNNKGDPTKFDKSENYVSKGLEKARSDTFSEIGFSLILDNENDDDNAYNEEYKEKLRTAATDENGNLIKDEYGNPKYIGNNKILGEYYDRFSELVEWEYNQEKKETTCKYKDDTYKTIVDACDEKIKKLYVKHVQKNVITSRNGDDVTKIALPKAITNCASHGKDDSDCIFKGQSTFQYNSSLIEDVCDKISDVVLEDCESLQYPDNIVWTEEDKEKMDTIQSNVEEQQEEVLEYLESKYMTGEKDKPRGCNVFGENTTPILKWVYRLIKIGAPLLVVVFGILDFVKALMSGEDKGFKESWSRFIKRLIAAVVVILLPVFLTFILSISGVLEQYGIKEKGNDLFCIFGD